MLMLNELNQAKYCRKYENQQSQHMAVRRHFVMPVLKFCLKLFHIDKLSRIAFTVNAEIGKKHISEQQPRAKPREL